MTRKEFVFLADALRAETNAAHPTDDYARGFADGRRDAIRTLATAIRRVKGQFDVELFLRNAGVA